MNSDAQKNSELTVAATLAGEDIACDEFVAVLHKTYDYPSWFWCGGGFGLSPHELVQLRFIPPDAGEPYQVLSVCLPFVYAKSANGQLETFDVRRVQLVRIDSDCAKTVWKQLQSKRRKSKGC